MDRARKSRAPVRAGVTKLCNEIESELTAAAPQRETLVELLEKLEVAKEKLQVKDKEVEEAMLDEDKPQQELETEFEEVQAYETKTRNSIKRVKLVITPQTQDSSSGANNGRGGSGSSTDIHIKLPKIELVKFSGDTKDWLSWWAQFKHIHENPNITDNEKFRYLVQSLDVGSKAATAIEGFQVTTENYPKAIDILEKQFGNPKVLWKYYLRELAKLIQDNGPNKPKMTLFDIYHKLESQLRALESLGTVTRDDFLYPLVETSIPEETLMAWQRSPNYRKDGSKEAPPKTELDYLREFLREEVENENIRSVGERDDGKRKEKSMNVHSKNSRNSIPTAASLYAGATPACCFCDKSNHSSADCYKARMMTVEDKRQKLSELNCCFKCLKKGHSAKKCRSSIRCFLCRKSHHTMMCGQINEEGSKTHVVDQQTETSNSSVSGIRRNREVLMKTLHVRVKGTTGKERQVRLLFDEGSQRSYIKTELAKELGCKMLGELRMQNCLFGGTLSEVKTKSKHQVQVRGLHTEYENTKRCVTLINEDIIASSCPTIPQGPWIQELAKKKIFVTDTWSNSLEVEILIGSDLWGSLITGNMFKLSCGLVAVESIFGWTLSGEIRGSIDVSYASVATTLTITDEKSLPDLWSLEAIGITDSPERITQEEQDIQMKKTFQENIECNKDGRYVVKLPWTCDNSILPNNRFIAEKRLENATRKLREQDKFGTYDNIFKDWLAEGIIEAVPAESKGQHFLPHRPVFKPESLTTPVRPVFDASCKMGQSVSLNDCLTKGPNLLELIPSILLRFREKKIGVISDIRKAFQMIEVQQEDRNFQKFLWWEDLEKKKIKEYRHCRVVFGMNCSPFMLAAVLDHHLRRVTDEKRPTADWLMESMYVDNSVTSFDTCQEYLDFREKATKIMAEAKMELRQWESNVDPFNTRAFNTTSVLGLKWDKEDDMLYCQLPKKIENLDEMKITKRNVLSFVSQIYDPIGFTYPAIIQPKLQIQDSWALKLKWDTEWEDAEALKFRKWSRELEDLARIKIPRHAFGEAKSQSIQFHCFTDASKSAYAAVIFVRISEGDKVDVQLLMARARVAPIDKKDKRVTIPRLELLGCLIGSILTHTVKKALNKLDVSTFYWSDSTTALAWIKRDADLGTFVKNRVKDIRRYSKTEQWRFVPGTMNPADLPSRGCSPAQLLESKWWEGPGWLKLSEEYWPKPLETTNEEDVKQELRKTPIISNFSGELPKPHFSSYLMNIRTGDWSEDLLIMQERKKLIGTKKFKTMLVQLGQDGLLRVHTRLTYKDDWENFKNPILLPNDNPMVEQLIMHVHRTFCHSGTQFLLNKLREKYWIIKGRKTVGNIIKKCTTCRRYSSKNYTSDPAPLPKNRIETQAAFQTTGVDLAGPLLLKGGKKAWIVIYTCAVYRGVYLDWVESISTEDFLDSLEKFTLTIGRPSTICSDNGTNFVGAHNLMKRLDWDKLEKTLNVKEIKWTFNPPTAAWWGGWWERLVRSVKDLLRKILGTARITSKGLTSCLASVSYVINNRPLTTLNEDTDDLKPLTPSMFMKDLLVAGLPEREAITSKDLQDSLQKIKDLKKALRERFRKEYLSQLIQRKAEKASLPPEIGHVVLVGADNKKRCEWPLGRIIDLFPGRDGKTRVAKVKTSSGILIRPLQRLYPLEVPIPKLMPSPLNPKPNQIEEEDEPPEGDENPVEEDSIVHTRSGRVINKPQRYGSWNK